MTQTTITIERDYPLDKLVFSEENPRQIKRGQFASLRKSLEALPDMLDVREIVIDENNKILAGHQRARALLANGKSSATVKRVAGWTEAQKHEFMVKDNAHSGEWDNDILANQWDASSLNEWGVKVPEPKEHDYYGDERERTLKMMNFDQFDGSRIAGKYEIPTLEACDFAPDELIGFNYAKTATNYNAGVHFFIDDYQFERVWTSPKKYMSTLAQFSCILTPDFSLYLDMPIAMMIWNVYRSRLLGQIAQDMGIRVIPTLVWADPRTYEFVFDGLPTNSTVAVSTVGVRRDPDAMAIWNDGMREAIDRLRPSQILLYGAGDVDFDFGETTTKKYTPRKFAV